MKQKTYVAGEQPASEWERFALHFVEALVQRRYEAAYAMLAESFKAQHSLEWLHVHIERLLVQSQEPFGPCQLFVSGPSGDPTDLGMTYTVIGGEFNEARLQRRKPSSE